MLREFRMGNEHRYTCFRSLIKRLSTVSLRVDASVMAGDHRVDSAPESRLVVTTGLSGLRRLTATLIASACRSTRPHAFSNRPIA